MIEIKEDITIYFEVIVGEPINISSKDKDYHSYKVEDYGYRIFYNRLGEMFKRDNGDWRFQKKLFIPFTNIKTVKEQYEYQIEEQDVFELVDKYCGYEGIKNGEIKKKIEENGVEISTEEINVFLTKLKTDKKIFWKSDLKAWVSKKVHDEISQDVNDVPKVNNNLQPRSISGSKRKRR